MNINEIYPIESISLPGIGELNRSGLIVLVGPNYSGKTQLLNDINSVLSGQRKLVVAENISFKKPNNAQEFLDVLVSEGYLNRTTDASEVYKRATSQFGIGGGHGDLNINQINNDFVNFNNFNPTAKKFQNIPFLNNFGNLFSTILFLQNRLTLVKQEQNFDWENVAPANDLQALFLNEEAQDALQEEVSSIFNKSVVMDFTRGNSLNLRIKNSKDMPSDRDRRLPSEMKKLRLIESEGDGLKSYIGICISLLLGRRPLCLIDEPELCLHPPQAYSLGKFIGKYGHSGNNLTIVATHNSHLLRGITETSNKASVIRLTNNNEFYAKFVDPNVLQEFSKKPIIRAESILDGIFSNAIILVESEGDRIVYETVWEKFSDLYPLDIRFVSVGGTGGFLEIMKFYDMLHIPNCIIADLDLILDTEKLGGLITEASTNVNFKESLIKDCREFKDIFKKIQPEINPEQLKKQVLDLFAKDLKWENEDDLLIRKSLGNMANVLNRKTKLKHGGVENFNDNVQTKTKLNNILRKLETTGIFCVPVGELEYWISELMSDGPSKQKKSQWANEASKRIKDSAKQNNDVWGFVEQVISYLSENLKTFHLTRTSSNI